MNRDLCRWQLSGFLFTAVSGTLLHFLYDWCGENTLIGAVSAVNESVWEHMKLLFIPMFFFTLAQAAVFGERHRNFWRVKFAGILAGLLLIPTLYYTYTGALGFRLVWIDISIFYVAAAAAFFLEARSFRHPARTASLELAALLAIWLLAFAFLLFTYAPPKLPIFQDPLTLTYGIV